MAAIILLRLRSEVVFFIPNTHTSYYYFYAKNFDCCRKKTKNKDEVLELTFLRRPLRTILHNIHFNNENKIHDTLSSSNHSEFNGSRRSANRFDQNTFH